MESESKPAGLDERRCLPGAATPLPVLPSGLLLLALLAAPAALQPTDVLGQEPQESEEPLEPDSLVAVGGECRSLIAFSSAREEGSGVYVMSPHGGESRLLAAVPGALQIAWSPDGRRLAFLSVISEDEEEFSPFAGLRFHAFLYTIRADGSDLRRVSEYPVTMGFGWSPDSRRFALASAVETGGGSTGIYVAAADGGEAWQRVTDLDGVHMFPAWSSDGSAIAFAAKHGDETSLRLVSPDGSERRTVLAVPGSRAWRLFRPVWAPGGALLAFGEGRGVYTVSAREGGVPQKIQDGAGEPHAWSPSRRKLLLGEGAEGRGRVFLVDLDTLGETQLAGDAGAAGANSPSPDWGRVAYTAIVDEQSDVMVVDVEKGTSLNLTQHPANDYFPAWSPCQPEK
jgi:Tol biopolymer transport system component